jgi:hypothetical protein
VLENEISTAGFLLNRQKSTAPAPEESVAKTRVEASGRGFSVGRVFIVLAQEGHQAGPPDSRRRHASLTAGMTNAEVFHARARGQRRRALDWVTELAGAMFAEVRAKARATRRGVLYDTPPRSEIRSSCAPPTEGNVMTACPSGRAPALFAHRRSWSRGLCQSAVPRLKARTGNSVATWAQKVLV